MGVTAPEISSIATGTLKSIASYQKMSTVVCSHASNYHFLLNIRGDQILKVRFLIAKQLHTQPYIYFNYRKVETNANKLILEAEINEFPFDSVFYNFEMLLSMDSLCYLANETNSLLRVKILLHL